MSTAKRSRQRHSEASVAASLPPTKKAKTSQDSHVPSSGLGFLADEGKRSGKKLQAITTNGIKETAPNRLDESQAVISGHAGAGEDVEMQDGVQSNAIQIDSDAESSEEQDSEEEEDAEVDTKTRALTNGAAKHGPEEEEAHTEPGAEDTKSLQKSTVADHNMEDQDTADAAGPSFGDLLQASYPDTIDVQAAFADRNPESRALVPANGDKVLQAPSATSLGTVLTQALRTNDKELLESCFQMTDAPSIRSTIQRLQSPLVASLLQKLAERLHKRPGRAGNLMIWVQWSLVSHGGYLAGQPQVMKKLKSLSNVVRERANGLQALMTLKGKLDMLSAQIELRRNMQAARQSTYDSDEEEAGVVYVEGEVDDSSSDEAAEAETLAPLQRKSKSAARQIQVDAGASSDEEDDDDIPMANGITNGVDDESSEGEDDEEAGERLLDDEAEETSDDEGEGTSEDDSEEELEEDDEASESEEDEAPASRGTKATSRSSMARRR